MCVHASMCMCAYKDVYVLVCVNIYVYAYVCVHACLHVTHNDAKLFSFM